MKETIVYYNLFIGKSWGKCLQNAFGERRTWPMRLEEYEEAMFCWLANRREEHFPAAKWIAILFRRRGNAVLAKLFGEYTNKFQGGCRRRNRLLLLAHLIDHARLNTAPMNDPGKIKLKIAQLIQLLY